MSFTISAHISWFGILLFTALMLQSCASFPDLPKNVSPSAEIVGMYSNDQDSLRYVKLWNLIDPESKYTFKEKDSTLLLGSTSDGRPTIEYIKEKQDSFFVRLEITQNNQLQAQLLQNNEVLSEKIIQGEFEDDQSYYTPRSFLIIPFFPIIWGWKNEKERIYHVNDYLVFEETRNNGVAILILSGGAAGNYKYLFRKIQ